MVNAPTKSPYTQFDLLHRSLELRFAAVATECGHLSTRLDQTSIHAGQQQFQIDTLVRRMDDLRRELDNFISDADIPG